MGTHWQRREVGRVSVEWVRGPAAGSDSSNRRCRCNRISRSASAVSGFNFITIRGAEFFVVDGSWKYELYEYSCVAFFKIYTILLIFL